MTTEFTRLTIIGTERKADLVVPNDEAVGGLLPRLMDLLGEASGSSARPLTLVRSTGEQLDVSLTVADQQILDGEPLRFVRSDDAPPPPEVADVTDVLGESLGERAGRWSTKTREATGAIAIGVLAIAVTALLPHEPVGLAIAFGILVLGAGVAGRLGQRWPAVAFTTAALGLAAAGCWLLTGSTALGGPVRIPAGIIEFTLAGWVALRVGFGTGLGSRPVRLGSYLGIVLSALPIAMVASGVAVQRTAAVTAVVALVVCGVLPRLALASSGLTGLDDQVVEGRPRRRDDVEVTVDDAYAMLSWATVAVAIPLALAPALLIASSNRWVVAIGGVAVLVTVLRTRAFPLTAQQMSLWFAVLAALIAGLVRQPRLTDGSVAAILCVVAALAVLLVLARPAAHQRAFWRRAGNLVEALGVIALVPLLLGAFGVYHDLLRAFGR